MSAGSSTIGNPLLDVSGIRTSPDWAEFYERNDICPECLIYTLGKNKEIDGIIAQIILHLQKTQHVPVHEWNRVQLCMGKTLFGNRFRDSRAHATEHQSPQRFRFTLKMPSKQDKITKIKK